MKSQPFQHLVRWSASLLLTAGLLGAGEDFNLLPPDQGDVGAAAVTRQTWKAAPALPPTAREKVHFSWPLAAEEHIDLQQPSHQTRSKSYRLLVDSADFEKGIALPLETSRPLIKISPQVSPNQLPGNYAVQPQDLMLVNHSGKVFRGAAGLEQLAAAEDLQRAHKNHFTPATTMFKVANEVGHQSVYLFAENLNQGDARRYVIQVFEKHAQIALGLQSTTDTYFAGEDLQIETTWFSELGKVETQSMRGDLIAPDGRRFALAFDKGFASARVRLPQNLGTANGLWRVEVQAVGLDGDTLVRRDAATAVAVSEAGARFSGDVVVARDGDLLVADLGVETAGPGRYEARAVLFGTDAEGAMVPLAVAHVADLLDQGKHRLDLQFELPAATDAGAPYELRDLRLIHQNAGKLLHRQGLGLRFDPDQP